jgi:hypothetical protein
MRWLALIWLCIGASCRPKPSAPVDAGTIEATDAPAVRARRATTLFARPISAVGTATGATVVGRDRATGRLALTLLEDSAAAREGSISNDGPAVIMSASAAGLDNPELVGAWPRVGILADAPDDAARRRVLLRVAAFGDGGADTSDLVPVGSATCSTADGVYSVARENDGWKGTFFPMTGGSSDGPFLPGRSDATIVCGRRRAFVVLAGSGEIRAARWLPGEHDARPTLLPKAPLADGEDETLMSTREDDLVVVKRDRSAFHTLVWSGDAAASWRKAEVVPREGRALEALEADPTRLALVLVRTVTKVKGCAGSETTDAVAEVAIVELDSGKLVHAPEAIETWKCGAEPGPFFTGWTGGKLVVAWPRGADVACARAGVKRGGLGYAEVDPSGGRAKVGRVARPAETLVEAGCGESRCYAVALTRGSDPCGAADGPESGRLELVAYPP